MDFENFKYHEKNLPIKLDEKNLFFEELRKEFLKEMKNSDENKDFFNNYSSSSIEFFMFQYSKLKMELCESYRWRIQHDDTPDLRMKLLAEEMFSTLKQKKLFNLQVEWRAENIELESITTSADFHFWCRNIDACFLVPEITDEDVEVLKEYILSDSYQEPNDFLRLMWQDYDAFTEGFSFFAMEYPEWYGFYDMRMGTGSLLLLPNNRGRKEMEYIMTFVEKIKAEIALKKENEIDVPKPKPLKNLYTNAELFMNEFAMKFETDPHIIEIFRIFKKRIIKDKEKRKEMEETYNPYNVNKIDDEEIDDTIYKMYKYYENFPMIGGHQWRDAIIISEQKYRLKTIHSLIDEVYEEYKLLNKLGISRSKSKKEMLMDLEADDLVTIRRKQILEGRKILGEPEDFNF